MSVETEARKQIESMKNDLQQLRDRIKLKLHLGNMELKDRFEKIEPDVHEFERRAGKVTHEVGDELREGWSHLKAALHKIDHELRGDD